MKKVSIIIPVYNTERYLRECLDSVCRQTYRNLEILLIDDGSTDMSPEICDEYARADDRITVIHQPNAGLSAARNAGLSRMTGDYVGFLDSDDWMEPDMIASMADALEQYSADICDSRIRMVLNGKTETVRVTGNIRVADREESLDILYADEDYRNFAWSKLFKSELFSDTVFPVGRLYEDIWVMHELYEKARKVLFWDRCFTFYRIRSDSITKSGSLKNAMACLDSLEHRAASDSAGTRLALLAPQFVVGCYVAQKNLLSQKVRGDEKKTARGRILSCLRTYTDSFPLSGKDRLRRLVVRTPGGLGAWVSVLWERINSFRIHH